MKTILRDLLSNKQRIEGEIHAIEEWIRVLEKGEIPGDVVDEIPIPKKLKFLKAPRWLLKKGVAWVLEKHIAAYREMIKGLEKTLSVIEGQITPLKILRDQLKGKIAEIEGKIKEIDEKIKSCRYPPTH